MRLKELAESRVRYGYRRLHVLLQRKGHQINHKRTHRLCGEEVLAIRTQATSSRTKLSPSYTEAGQEPILDLGMWARTRASKTSAFRQRWC